MVAYALVLAAVLTWVGSTGTARGGSSGCSHRAAQAGAASPDSIGLTTAITSD
jgi:hypothetical protein